MTSKEEGAMLGLHVPREIAADVPARVLAEWKADYREDAADRFGRALLWEPYLADKLAEYQAQSRDAQPARLPGGAH